MNAVAMLAALSLAACVGELQSVRMDAPVGAVAHIAAATPVTVATPFIGQFETGTLDTSGGLRVEFTLDAMAAARIGASQPITIYGRLWVGKQTELSATQTLRLGPSEASLRSLVRGEVSEITAFVSDPNEAVRLAQITMRMQPF